MKEIGSIFPLTEEQISNNKNRPASFPQDRIYYSLCREAFSDIACHLGQSNKIVLIPAYTCQTVISPFEELGWDIVFYSIRKDLRIDIEDLRNKANMFKPAVIVSHPYFGMDFNEEEDIFLSELKLHGIKIIIDLTQCIFSKHDYKYADYITGSYRKWFPIPDGGFLVTDEKGFGQPQEENIDFTESQSEAMYLRHVYFHNCQQLMKVISIKLNKMADHIAERPVEPHRMSDLAYNLLSTQDFESNQTRRLENFKFLSHNISDGTCVRKVCHNFAEVTTAPLYFTIYVSHRKELQMILAQNSVYAPVIWPVEEDRVLINEEVQYIYEHLLAIPCDQRYDKDDMQRIVKIINEFNEKN